MAVALSADCCGESFALGRPRRSLRGPQGGTGWSRREVGIKRVVFVCPGCRDEWEATAGAEAFELVALPELLAAAGARPRPEKVAALAGCDDPVLAMLDSCHDRNGRFGGPLRRIFADGRTVELAHHGKSALCCGAAGAVSLVDQPLCDARAHRVLDEEPRQAGADLVW